MSILGGRRPVEGTNQHHSRIVEWLVEERECQGLGQDQASNLDGCEDLLVRTMRDLDNINQVGLA